MNYKCELVEQPAQPVLSIRTRSVVENLPQVFGQAYGAIIKYLSEIGEYPSGPPFAAYYNLDMQDLDVEAGFPVTKALPGKDSIKPGEIPGGKFASCLYTGPYSECEPAYNALTEWIKEKGCTPTGVAYEFYLNDPAQTPESELQTRIMIPIK
ncbi:MAG: GyrI-like domain-containing protein [Actinobacteria bacterium]|nr:GyrI-like domain-containing protein [Actinomycetota bacterium]